jgi:glycine/D-amino acid oxidase-like deaminating enzyme
LICGGGVIGAAVAYFLSRRGAEVIIVERTAVACAASGKSGGFLALDWCDGTPLEMLARRSFALHARLAEEVGVDWGYRRLDTFGGIIGVSSRQHLDPSWVSDRVAIRQRLGLPETTAQVHPARFTRAMMRAAEANGTELHIGEVSGVLRDSSGDSVAGVRVDGEDLLGDAVVIAMGPWSILAATWLPMPPVFGLKGHSIVFDTAGAVPAEALFLEMRDA